MSYTVQYRITSITNPDKVYASKQDFWDDHNKSSTIDKSSVESGKVESYISELDAGGKSITKTILFVDEDAFNTYVTEATNLLSSLGIVDDELNYTKL
jgi:hypothetical protein